MTGGRGDRSVGAGLVVTTLAASATGLRSLLPLAATLRCRPHAELPAPLRGRPARLTLSLAAAGELAVDLWPKAPARTEAPGLVARAVNGAACAWLLQPRGRRTPALAALGAGVAMSSAFCGLEARRALAARVSPVAAALVEDGVTVLLAALALRAAPSPG